MDNLGHDLTFESPILVTGDRGYLGSNVVAHASARGWPVQGACNPQNESYDLTDLSAVETMFDKSRPAAIVHCAAQVPKGAKDYDDELAASANLRMCSNLAATASCPIVFASSMTVYGDAPPVPVRVDDVAPVSAYAKAKLAAEKIFADLAKEGCISLRLPGLFGPPRRTGLLYNSARAFLSGQPFKQVTPFPVWAAMDVRDASDYILRAVALSVSTPATRTYNVGYPEHFSVVSATRRLAWLCNVDLVKISSGPVFAMDLDATHSDLGTISITFEDRLRQLRDWVAKDLAGTPTGKEG